MKLTPYLLKEWEMTDERGHGKLYGNQLRNRYLHGFILYITARVSHMKPLNMFYLIIYWTQKLHNDFIFLCSIVLPPVGHSSNHQYHCCQLTRQSSCGSNFYRTFKVFIWLSPVYIYIYTYIYMFLTQQSHLNLYIPLI